MSNYFLPHAELIKKVIYVKLINDKFYIPDDFEDLYMEVAEYLIKNELKIIGNYRNEAKLSTYLAKITANYCSKLMQKKINKRKHLDDLVYFDNDMMFNFLSNIRDYKLTSESRMILNEACRRLRYILDTYGSDRDKLVFCLKAIYRIILALTDLQRYWKNETIIPQIEIWVEELNEKTEEKSLEEIKALVTSIFNLLEKSNNSPDAIRKWINDRVNQIITQLNRPPFRSQFETETFKLLFSRCFDKPEKESVN